MSELKPCPVCNEAAQKFFGYDYGKVGCKNDDCNYRNRPQYADQWNNRPHEDRIKSDAIMEAANDILGYSGLTEYYEQFKERADKMRGEK